MRITARQLSHLIREATLDADEFAGVESVDELLDGLEFITDNIKERRAAIETNPQALEVLERVILVFNRATIDVQYAGSKAV